MINKFIRYGEEPQDWVSFLGKKFQVESEFSPPHPAVGYCYCLTVAIDPTNWGLGNRLRIAGNTGTNTHPDEFLASARIYLVDDQGKEWKWLL
jgi:hypothetical protein